MIPEKSIISTIFYERQRISPVVFFLVQIYGKLNGMLNTSRVLWKTQLEISYQNWILELYSDQDSMIGSLTVKMDSVKAHFVRKKD